MIKLMILDIDGVMTDGKKYYQENGVPFAKTFSDKDWTAIKRFRSVGVDVIFLTGDARVNEAVANNRKIPVYLSRGKDKAIFTDEFSSTYNCTLDEMAYVGDDLFDINIMTKVKYSFATNDSPSIVKNNCVYTLNSKGGDNVIVELFEFCESRGFIQTLNLDETMKRIEELDKKEFF